MRALVVDRFDPLGEGTRLADIAPPSLGPGRIQVRMLYAPVNPSDLNHIRGTYYDSLTDVIWNRGRSPVTFDPERLRPCPAPPLTLGAEGVGIVEATGGGLLARRLRGKRVSIAADPLGTWADICVTDARRAVVLPRSVPDEQAAMFFVNPLTAWILAHEVLRVRRNGWLLVTAAGSALGRMVLRLAVEAGWQTIAVVRRSEAIADMAAAGATHVVATDAEPLVEAVQRLTDGRGVRWALDCVGGPLAAEVAASLGLGGHMVSYGTLDPTAVTFSPRAIMMPAARWDGFFLPAWLSLQSPLRLLGVLRNVRRRIAAGVLTSDVGRICELEDWPAALTAAQDIGRSGKVLFRIRPTDPAPPAG